MPKLKRRRASKDALATESSVTKTETPEEHSPAAKTAASQTVSPNQTPRQPPRVAKEAVADHGEDGSDFGAGIFDSDDSSKASQSITTSVQAAAPPTSGEAATGEKPARRAKRGRRGGSRAKKAAQEHEKVASPQAAMTQTGSATGPSKTAAVQAVPDEENSPTDKPRGRGRGSRRGSADNGRVEARTAPEPDKSHVAGTAPDEEVPAKPVKAGPAAQPKTTTEKRRRSRRKEPSTAQSGSSATKTASSIGRKMLINVADPDECRIALLQKGRLDELYIERATSTSNVGNIYKGRVTNVEASIQAAFVDFGRASHGFLHISDLHPKYFPHGKGETEQVGRKTPRRQRPPIQNCLRRGDTVIVQIIKEGIGTKGPTLTSYISLPGRFLVMMPGMDQLGVSRKIEDEDQRRKAREVLGQLALPKDMGFIVRTAGVDRTKRDLQRDLNYLGRLWKKVAAREKTEPAPAELYKESDLVIRTIRDVFDSSVSEILVDNASVASKVREFLAVASPRSRNIVTHYDSTEPVFYKYGIEAEIDSLHSRHVSLPCGGSLVIEQTEALVAIDVNSGRFRVPDNAEETAYRVDIEAVDEIARQLRLRDLGGLIICDMIDLGHERHIRDIENRFRDALKKHKERAKVLRMSKFGIIEMTRQRQRPSLAKSNFRECPRCFGTGRIKATESVALDVMRQVRLAAHRGGVARIDVEVAVDVANELQNRKRRQMAELEQGAGLRIQVVGRPGVGVEHVRVSCTDRRGREVVPTVVGDTAVTETVSVEANSRGVAEEKAPPRRSKRGRRSRKHTGTVNEASRAT